MTPEDPNKVSGAQFLQEKDSNEHTIFIYKYETKSN